MILLTLFLSITTVVSVLGIIINSNEIGKRI